METFQKQAQKSTTTRHSASHQSRTTIPNQHAAGQLGVDGLRRTLGNQALLRHFGIQAKCLMSKPGDAFERQADRVGDHIMSVPTGSPYPIQRKCTACALEYEDNNQHKLLPASGDAGRSVTGMIAGMGDRPIQLKAQSSARSTDRHPALAPALRQGQALSRSEQQFFEPRFGADFSHVRIHTHADANRSAHDMGARAYTYGHHIVFNSGEYQGGSRGTRQLLAHELTHVIQQNRHSSLPAIQRTTTRGAGGCGPLRSIDEDLDGARAAGRTAHTQLQTFLLRSSIGGELEVPRATKRHMSSRGCQPPRRHEGFADLWKPGAVIGIAEIKPIGFATQRGIARDEAEHYVRRSRQSVDRLLSSGTGPERCGSEPAGDDDRAFRGRIGMRGGIAGRKRFTMLRGILPTATTIGSFDGDRSRTLRAKMTEPGSVGYWCTGGRSTTYPCDSIGRQVEDYIDSILSNAQGALDDCIRDNLERPINEMIESFSVRDMLSAGKRFFWPQLREAIRRELGPTGYLVPNDISTDELADIIDNQLGPGGRIIVQTLLRRFKSLVINEMRRLMRDMLRSLIRQALTELCVGVPAVTLATLLDRLRELFRQQMRILIPIAVTAVAAQLARAMARAIIEAVAEITSFVLRILAIVALIILALGTFVMAIISLIALFDPVPGDEAATGAATLVLAELTAALFVFILTGEMPEEEGGGA
jgi:hypothetical protein